MKNKFKKQIVFLSVIFLLSIVLYIAVEMYQYSKGIVNDIRNKKNIKLSDTIKIHDTTIILIKDTTLK